MDSKNQGFVYAREDAKPEEIVHQEVAYARPGENVQLKMLHLEEEMIAPGNILCMRESPMHATQVFEAEVDVLDLLEYRPIISKGYKCMIHIHTYSDEIIIKDIIWAQEK